MKQETIDKIKVLREEYLKAGEAEYLVDEIISEGKLSLDDINTILSSESNYFKSRFLEKYNDFDKKSLKLMQKYILTHLDDPDRFYVSDLMEFAIDWDLELPYEKCIEFLKYDDDENVFVQYYAIEYVFQHLDFDYIKPIIKNLLSIANSAESDQSAQVRAAFVLFRITHKREHLESLINFVVSYDHRELLWNILKDEHNSQEYFDYHDFLVNACGLYRFDNLN